MKNKKKKEEGLKFLKGAYAIETPEDSISYYKDFSKHYDLMFADALDYSYPKRVAEELFQNFNGKGNICDIGCGTGLVGKELSSLNPELIIDGFDISAEMIKKAKEKNIYRNFYEIDLTRPISNVPTNYSAIISAGAFTHGHLGPKTLVNLLLLCNDNAFLTIGINAAHYREKGFERMLNELQSSSKIKMIKISKQPIYSKKNQTKDEEDQVAIISTFIKIKN
jgi:trans-aconitate methyltransferase